MLVGTSQQISTSVPSHVSKQQLSELAALENIIERAGPALEVKVLQQLSAPGSGPLPIHAICLGNPSTEVPAIGFFGGVHGLERIGTEVVMAYLRSVVHRLQWDQPLRRQLETVRLVFVPIVNPGGMWQGTRANPGGVDLMRNAPVEAMDRVPFLVGGQRISNGLPWYRGKAGAALEPESQALCDVVQAELLSRRFSLAIDCHSGFGARDRIWFPYARSAQPIAHLAEMHALKDIFFQSYSQHQYVFEPQSLQYLAHGDLWDHLYLQSLQEPQHTFLPLTLEMGSWLWIKKNPRQLFSRLGIFNPLIEHRQQRVLRRHISLLDFLARAAASQALWLPQGEARAAHQAQALREWYA
jgi:hypothetical protein